MQNIETLYTSIANAMEGVSKLSDLRDHKKQY